MAAMIMRLAVIQMDHTFVSVKWVILEMDLTAQVRKHPFFNFANILINVKKNELSLSDKTLSDKYLTW